MPLIHSERSFILALGAVCLLSGPPLLAAVSSSFDAASGRLSISVSDLDTVTLTQSSGRALVNGGNPATGPLPLADIRSIFVSSDSTGNTVNFSSFAASGVPNIEEVVIEFGDGEHTFSGSDMDERIVAGAGGMLIKGGGGDDTIVLTNPAGLALSGIEGNAGVDTVELHYGDAADGVSFSPFGANLRLLRNGVGVTFVGVDEFVVNMGGGDDFFVINNLASVAELDKLTFDLGAGDDTFDASNLTAGSLSSLEIRDTELGTNTILDSRGDDTIELGPGSDTVTLSAGTDSVSVGEGNNRVRVARRSGNNGDVTVDGGSGDNKLDILLNGAATGRLRPASQASRWDFVPGGGITGSINFANINEVEVVGNSSLLFAVVPNPTDLRLDVVRVSGQPAELGVEEGPSEVVGTILAYSGDYLSPVIERSSIPVSRPAILYGTNVSNTRFIGNDGPNSYTLGPLPSGSTATTAVRIESGGGIDSIAFSNLPANVAVTARLGAGADSASLGAGTVELDGGEDADFLNDGGGNAVILGGAGDDSIIGGGGNDTIDGGPGSDRVTWRVGDGGDAITAEVIELNGGNELVEQRLFFLGTPGPAGTSRSISWAAGTNPAQLIGIGATDRIEVSTGLLGDTITAVSWAGGDPVDKLSIFSGSGSDTIDLRGFPSNAGINSIEVLAGDDDDVLYAPILPASMFGGFGDDEFFALGGNDTLVGDADADVFVISGDTGTSGTMHSISGGSGANTVRYIPPAAGTQLLVQGKDGAPGVAQIGTAGTTGLPITDINTVQRIEINPPFAASGPTEVTVRLTMPLVQTVSFAGTFAVVGDRIEVIGTDAPDRWTLNDSVLTPESGTSVEVGIQVEQASFDLGGGDDFASTDSSETLSVTFIGGDGDADQFSFRSEGLETTVVPGDPFTTWQQPTRVDVRTTGFELNGGGTWMLY